MSGTALYDSLSKLHLKVLVVDSYVSDRLESVFGYFITNKNDQNNISRYTRDYLECDRAMSTQSRRSQGKSYRKSIVHVACVDYGFSVKFSSNGSLGILCVFPHF